MKKLFLVLLGCACGLLVLQPLACGPESTPMMVVMGPTPTPGAGAGIVTATFSDTFSPASVTITHGSAVTFVLGGGFHTLYIDNGSGTCAQNYATWPQTIVFPSAGTFNFHCSIHSPCGTGSCSSCTGMTGQVMVK